MKILKNFFTKPKEQTSSFIRLTRVYKDKQSKLIKNQPIVIQKSSIESYRPRNKLTGNRTTIVTTSGKYINVREKRSEIERLLAA